MGVQFDTKRAAEYLTCSPKTLEKWRVYGSGPVYVKIGNLCRYRQVDLDIWIESRRRVSTSDRGER